MRKIIEGRGSDCVLKSSLRSGSGCSYLKTGFDLGKNSFHGGERREPD